MLTALVLTLGACSGDEANVTKRELQKWLEEGNSDNSAADPGCVLDPMWDAGLSDAELQEFIDLGETGDVPSAIGVYTAIRDECNAEALAAQCAAGLREPIECGDVTSDLDFSHLEKCDDYFGEGVILRAAVAFDLAGCVTAEGDPAFYFPIESQECADGRTLYWADDAGWGYDGEPWHADAFEPPAAELASCRG